MHPGMEREQEGLSTRSTPLVLPCSEISEELSRLRERWSSLAYLRRAHPADLVEVTVSESGTVKGTVEDHCSLTMAFGEQFLSRLDDDWKPVPSRFGCIHLAQCPLQRLPNLLHDVAAPACVSAACHEPPLSNLWFCIGAGRSSLHYDCYSNVLFVVRGVKHLLLLPPSVSCPLMSPP